MADPFTIEEYVAGDGYRCRYRRYSPTSPRGNVVCIHGIQSHAGWYEGSCAFLARSGFEVFFLDRRGSGMNQEGRGDAPSFRRLLDDLADFVGPLRSASPLPCTLLAISWGGKLGVALQRRHQGLVDRLALLCPGFYPRVRVSFGQRLAIFANRFCRPRKLFPIPLNEPELFTANPTWLDFLRRDPLALHQATARFLLESARLDGYLRFCRRHVTLPLLLLLAGKDRIIQNEPTRRLVASFASPANKVIEYPEAHHTLEFEPEPERIWHDLRDWLEGK